MSLHEVSRKLSKSRLECLLKPKLGRDLIVKECKYTPNTKPGENYGSVMLALEITICHTESSLSETLNVVAKFAPPTDFLQSVFDFKNTFCKEMNLYKLVGPEIENMQKESEIPDEEILNVLAKFYGAQTSLRGDLDITADDNAVLLLENLKVSGYKMADRLSGLDLKHSELVVSKLAQFHALPIALKHKKPKVFEKTVSKATAFSNFVGGTGNLEKDLESILKSMKQLIPECGSYEARIRAHCDQYVKLANKSLQKEPFATIVHNDFWTNNIMFLYNNTHPTDVKFVDFQITLLCSPVKDLIFFLFSSVQDEVLKEHYDHLINLYYLNFINSLKRVGCDISAFSYLKFLDEINEFAPTQFYHVLFMLNVIYAQKSDVKDLKDIDDNIEIVVGSGKTCRQKLYTHIEEFDKRGWLKKTV
ncbi:uncharacterized protein [Anabrus simplex]|uniref:uncharacterized protein n=1 Tax=Anabrus simplex TaxID=316456 RepID=UPI0035A2B938